MSQSVNKKAFSLSSCQIVLSILLFSLLFFSSNAFCELDDFKAGTSNFVLNDDRVEAVYVTDDIEYSGHTVVVDDFNGDGYDDVIIGAPLASNSHLTEAVGKYYLFLGGKTASEGEIALSEADFIFVGVEPSVKEDFYWEKLCRFCSFCRRY